MTTSSKKTVWQNIGALFRYFAANGQPFWKQYLGIYFFYALGITAGKILIPVVYQQVIDGMLVSSSTLESVAASTNYQLLLQLATYALLLWFAGYESPDLESAVCQVFVATPWLIYL